MARGLRLAIELSPEWVAASLMRGEQLEGLAVEPIDAELWERAWSDHLRPLDAALKSCVDQLDASGAHSIVFHYSPEAVAEIFSCPARGAAAMQAATLALTEQSGVDPAGNPCQIVPIAHDRSGSPKQTHLLMTADRDSTASSIAEWVKRAGLRLDGIAPAEGGHLTWLVQRLVKIPDNSGRVLMWIGSHRSALAVGGGGRLSLVRRLDIGVETLISALCKTSLTQGDSGIPTLSREDARTIINTIGIPEAKSDVDAARGLRGYHLLPLLQPILQKCIVELKQSIRFGLDEGGRAGAKLSIVGPGAAVPRLGQVLSEQTEIELDPIGALDNEQSDLSVALLGLPSGCNLLPLEEARIGSLRRIRRSLWTGGAVAAATALVLCSVTLHESSQASGKLKTMRGTISDLEAVMLERESGNTEIAAIERVLVAGDEQLGDAPRYADFLRELTLLTPESVRLGDISYSRTIENDKAGKTSRNRVELRGTAKANAEGASPDLTTYIQTLSKSPLVASVTLGATERAELDGSEALRFTLTLTLVPTLGNPARIAAVQGGTGQ